MKSKRTPTIEEVDDKLQEIAYGPAKRPWPRSAKITVWVLGIVLGLLLLFIGVFLVQVLSAPIPGEVIVY